MESGRKGAVLYIYGASGHGKVVYDAAKRMGLTVAGFVDDDEKKSRLLGLPVKRFSEIENHYVIALGIGNNRTRKEIYDKVKTRGMEVATIIDPNAVLSDFVDVGEGTVIFANCVINNSAKIGIGCIINTSAVIEHDCLIGDFSHISPNAALAGGVKVGSYTQIGIGASVREGISIGNNVIVGAGAVVVKDVPDNVVVVGNPAKILRKNEQ